MLYADYRYLNNDQSIDLYKKYTKLHAVYYMCFNVYSINVVVYGFSSDNNCYTMIAILMQYTTFVGTYNILCK